MILRKTRGIIFRTVKYSETSLILDIYTFDFGLKSFIVSGVRKSKTKSSASLLQLLSIIEFTSYPSETDKLSRIKEYHIFHKYTNLTLEVIRTSVGIFLLELSRNSIKEKEENQQLYEFIERNLINLDTIDFFALNNFYLQYIINLTEYLGFYPMKNRSIDTAIFDLFNGRFVKQNEHSKYTMNESQSAILNQLITASNTFSCTKIEREELVNNLLLYYTLHVPDFKNIKSLDVLREVMR